MLELLFVLFSLMTDDHSRHHAVHSLLCGLWAASWSIRLWLLFNFFSCMYSEKEFAVANICNYVDITTCYYICASSEDEEPGRFFQAALIFILTGCRQLKNNYCIYIVIVQAIDFTAIMQLSVLHYYLIV
jgi:hypothetical protein